MDQQSTRTDITVDDDGLWMLQALLDIRHVAPEPRCGPSVSTDSSDWPNEHPGMAVLREQGIVAGELNAVNKQVAARMRVLAAPDLEVVTLQSRGKLLYAVVDDENQPPGSRDIPDNEFRVMPARRGQHWVSAVRVGSDSVVFQRRPSGCSHPLDYRIETLARSLRLTHRQHTWPRYGTGQRELG